MNALKFHGFNRTVLESKRLQLCQSGKSCMPDWGLQSRGDVLLANALDNLGEDLVGCRHTGQDVSRFMCHAGVKSTADQEAPFEHSGGE